MIPQPQSCGITGQQRLPQNMGSSLAWSLPLPSYHRSCLCAVSFYSCSPPWSLKVGSA